RATNAEWARLATSTPPLSSPYFLISPKTNAVTLCRCCTASTRRTAFSTGFIADHHLPPAHNPHCPPAPQANTPPAAASSREPGPGEISQADHAQDGAVAEAPRVRWTLPPPDGPAILAFALSTLVIHSTVTALPLRSAGRGDPAGGVSSHRRRPAGHHATAAVGARRGRADLWRTPAQPLAPLLFGAVSDYIFGGGTGGAPWAFLVTLLPPPPAALLPLPARRALPGRGGGGGGQDRAGRPWSIRSVGAAALTPRPGVEVRPKPLSPTGQAGDQVVLRGWPALFAGTAYAAAKGEPWGQAGRSAG